MNNSGIPYFPLDCQLDEKFELIEAEFGLTGFAIVVKLFQRIYGGQGYYCEWTNEVALLFGKRNMLGDNAVSEIVRASVKRGIFDKNIFDKYHVLTSKGIQERYFEAVSRRKSVNVKKEYLLLNCNQIPKNVDISSENVSNSIENVSNFEQRKEEKRKEEYRREEESNAPDSPPTQISEYGEYKHVQLTDEQYKNLVDDYGQKNINEYIKKIDEYCQQYGKTYKDYNLTMRSWLKKDNVFDKNEHSYELDEIYKKSFHTKPSE